MGRRVGVRVWNDDFVAVTIQLVYLKSDFFILKGPRGMNVERKRGTSFWIGFQDWEYI